VFAATPAREVAVLTADRAGRTVAGVARFCATAGVETDLLAGVAARVAPVVPYDTGVWFATDPATVLFTEAWVDGFAASTCGPWFHHELATDDVNLFRSLAGTRRAAVLSRTVDDPADSARWRDLMRPLGMDAEVRLAADDASGTWAAVELHREVGASDFDEAEVRLLTALGPVVAAGLRRLTVERSALVGHDVDGPGLVLVAPDGTVSGGTAAGEAWLSLLVSTVPGSTSSALLSLVALAQAPPDRPRRLRVRTADGRWVTLHAAPLSSGEGSAIIVEPSAPSDVAEMLARAHGLTPRERDVALGLARGESTEALANRLVLSPHTVRDHLKTVFRKVGVASRAELVAHLFSAYYADRLFGGGPRVPEEPR
jgi:DNA-binding CsgD family transcriptional regulator